MKINQFTLDFIANELTILPQVVNSFCLNSQWKEMLRCKWYCEVFTDFSTFYFLLCTFWEFYLIFYKFVNQQVRFSEQQFGDITQWQGRQFATMWKMVWAPAVLVVPLQAGLLLVAELPTRDKPAKLPMLVFVYITHRDTLYTQVTKLENTVTTGWQRIISYFILFLLRIEAGSVSFILVSSQWLQF